MKISREAAWDGALRNPDTDSQAWTSCRRDLNVTVCKVEREQGDQSVKEREWATVLNCHITEQYFFKSFYLKLNLKNNYLIEC